MNPMLAYLAGLLTIPALLLAVIALDLLVNFRRSSRSECQWCDWSLDERPGRPLWWVEIRFRIHRDLNHRAEYLNWKAGRGG